MNLYLNGLPYGYELQRVAQMFFFGDKVLTLEGAPPETGEFLYVRQTGARLEAGARLKSVALGDSQDWDPQKPAVMAAWDDAGPGDAPAVLERKLGVLLYHILARATGFSPPWGVITGIRPVKYLAAGLAQGKSPQQLYDHFVGSCLVSEGRFALAMQTARVEESLLARSTPDSFSLYISIPFCPTRCAYCSFVSHSVEKAAKLIPEYVEKLCEELVYTGKLARRLDLKLRTVYFGGGTPTTLDAGQLSRIMDTIADHFDVESAWEYTVEAGRPDTITREKLEAIRRAAPGARISINPQTLSDSVLRAIGRRHTTGQLRDAFTLARDCGFGNINMDLIAGLPTDTAGGFRASLDGAAELGPENITVHTLTVKRAAHMTFEQARAELELVGGMVDYARGTLGQLGYAPYYLYRQTGSLSCLENVGYARPGFEGLYNVYIMDETHSILAVGAGASTKLRHPGTGELKRIYNYKYPYEYISRFEAALERKNQILDFYGG